MLAAVILNTKIKQYLYFLLITKVSKIKGCLGPGPGVGKTTKGLGNFLR